MLSLIVWGAKKDEGKGVKAWKEGRKKNWEEGEKKESEKEKKENSALSFSGAFATCCCERESSAQVIQMHCLVPFEVVPVL